MKTVQKRCFEDLIVGGNVFENNGSERVTFLIVRENFSLVRGLIWTADDVIKSNQSVGGEIDCRFPEGRIISVKLWDIRFVFHCDTSVLGCIRRCLGVNRSHARVKVELMDVLCVADETSATLRAFGSAAKFRRSER